MATLRFREQLQDDDPAAIRALAAATGFFNSGEVAIAEELALERLQKGSASGYEFILAEREHNLLGYSCFGLIPCTQSSYDLYWIAVSPVEQKAGLGRMLLEHSEEAIRRLGGTRLYADTSGRAQYLPTRTFYQKCGFILDAQLKDFYAPDDDKCIFVKPLI